jgi:hypothetical protein
VTGGPCRSRPGSCWRLDPETVHERFARRLIGGESLCLPARPVERQHQLRAEALAQRVLGDERLDLADQRGSAAECEIGLDPALEHRQPQLLEATDRGLGEGLVFEVGESPASPERERVAEQARRKLGLGRLGLRNEPFEPLQVELSGPQAQHVAGCSGLELLRCRAERLPELRHPHLQRRHAGVGGLAAPEFVDQAVAGDDLADVEQKDRQHGALLAACEGELAIAVSDLKWAEDAEFHAVRASLGGS